MSTVSNHIEMEAPRGRVFEIVSNLPAWPRHLPHYRWIRVMESNRDHQLVRMACYRNWIPIDWVSKYWVDPVRHELHFEHQKAFTKGMKVVWHLEPIRGGNATQVTIEHDLLAVRKRLGSVLADRIIAGWFIDYVATRTLRSFARKFASESSSLSTLVNK